MEATTDLVVAWLASGERKLCRHCGRDVTDAASPRPRGLCWSCYYRPGVRDLHPSGHRFARRGLGHSMPTAAPEPTDTLPGTPDKVAALAERMRSGRGLWHDEDARRDER